MKTDVRKQDFPTNSLSKKYARGLLIGLYSPRQHIKVVCKLKVDIQHQSVMVSMVPVG